MRLLLIEDEEGLADAISYILKGKKYGVDTAYDGETGQDMAETGIYDVVILDRMLPKKDGISVLKNLRAKGIKTPVLLLTARDSVEDRVEGLDAGADDYLVKPFATEELLARIRALGRRPNANLLTNSIIIGSAVFEPDRCELTCNGQVVKLTVKESQLLELFLRNPEQVVSKEQILTKIWGYDSEIEINNIDTYVYFLRKKIKNLDCQFYIETVRGVGYCLKGGKNV